MLRGRPHAATLLMLVAAVVLTGCNKTTSHLGSTSSLATASTTPVSLEALADLRDKWQANPKDLNKGLAYANGLEGLGQEDEALNVYQRIAEEDPSNAKLAVFTAANW